MPSEVLSRQALNRALLARQMLLRRSPLPPSPPALDGPAGTGGTDGTDGTKERGERAARVIETVEHLAGLQAQAPFPPYYGLWSRLADFRPDDLAELILSRQVVRIALMRGTIHLVSARDCLLLRPLIQPVLDRGLAAGFGKQLGGLDTAELAAAGRALVEDQPRTFSDLGSLLATRWPGYPPAALAQAIRALVPLVQVPPRAIWGAAGSSAHTSAQAWLGAPLNARPSPDQLVIRYLAAFGPATVMDMQSWSGLTRLREVAERQRPGLRTFRNEDGGELFDLPAAPRPDPGTPAPVRLVAEFDNLVLSHADRTRIISAQDRPRLFTRNGIFPGTVLVSGFVTGMWKIARSPAATTLTIEMFGPVAAADRDAITGEGERLLAFAAPDARTRGIRFAPLT
jgi:Winged helix DNA-binding domain